MAAITLLVLILMWSFVWAFFLWMAYDCGYDDGWNDRHNLNKGYSLRDKIAFPIASFILRHVASPWYRDTLDRVVREGLAQAKKEHGIEDKEGS